jgi:flavin reductase (DIM6/NTAB) family NADH-FMN oxidoreductase RutF
LSSTTIPSAVFRRACSLFATGVAVLGTTDTDGAPQGLTINAFSSLSLDPQLVMVAVDQACTSIGTFETSGHYAVNILREEQRELSIRFAELEEGRFAGVPWKPGVLGSPVIEGVLGVIECRTVQVVCAGDHQVLIGQVVVVWIGEGRPLIFYKGAYTRLGE